jgi:Flp pilus assembly pilin Flp
MEKQVNIQRFLQKDQGTVTVEYVIFVAVIAIILTVGVVALMHAMSNYFNDWAQFFGG